MNRLPRGRGRAIFAISLSKVRRVPGRVPGLARATRVELSYGERERDILAVKRYSDSKAESHVAEAVARASRPSQETKARNTGGASEKREA